MRLSLNHWLVEFKMYAETEAAMNSMFGQVYILVVAAMFLTIWMKHYWLIRFVLNKHMSNCHKLVWQKMKDDTGWYRPNWATLYFSKAVYDFIWRSEESFGDANIPVLRRRIKRIIWELPLFFGAIPLLTVLLIRTLK